MKIGLITGGRSAEHDVAIQSACHIIDGLKQLPHDIVKFVISKEGGWHHDGDSLFTELTQCDVLFPVMHGPYGEDGPIQGLCEIVDKPYVGMNLRAAAICMDKVLAKQLLSYHGIPVTPFIGVTAFDWIRNPDPIKCQIKKSLRYPIFVKGAHLGSSIGVYRIASGEQLDDAMNEACKFDTKFIIENGLQAREIEFAVIGNEEFTVFSPGEVLTHGEIYSYEKKYGKKSLSTTVDPDLTQEEIERGIALAKQVYQAVGGDGMARIDFFLDQRGKFWCNEINPIPGFTNISLFPKICARHGLPIDALVEKLISLAWERYVLSKRGLSIFSSLIGI